LAIFDFEEKVDCSYFPEGFSLTNQDTLRAKGAVLGAEKFILFFPKVRF
jgi:hypothetical protein